jgi:hypothetical protein
MLTHTTHVIDVLYYEVLDLPLPQLEQLKSLKASLSCCCAEGSWPCLNIPMLIIAAVMYHACACHCLLALYLLLFLNWFPNCRRASLFSRCVTGKLLSQKCVLQGMLLPGLKNAMVTLPFWPCFMARP